MKAKSILQKYEQIQKEKPTETINDRYEVWLEQGNQKTSHRSKVLTFLKERGFDDTLEIPRGVQETWGGNALKALQLLVEYYKLDSNEYI